MLYILSYFYDLIGFNHAIFYGLNSFGNYGLLPYLLYALTLIFDLGPFIIYYFALCLWAYWHINSGTKKAQNFSKIFYLLIRIGTCFALLHLIYAELKFSFNLTRPLCELPAGSFSTLESVDSVRCNASFPSAHAARALLVCYFLWPYADIFPKRAGLVTLLAMVSLSRISLAMHYPADIIYSLIIMAFIIVLTNLLCLQLKKPVISRLEKVIFPLLFRK